MNANGEIIIRERKHVWLQRAVAAVHVFMGLKPRTNFLTLFLCVSVMLSVEVVSDWPALFNEYNWFHLP